MDKLQVKFALITPSYAPDFQRCQLLAQSIEHCLIDDTKQYIVVDHQDVSLFKPLTSSKIKILIVEELLPFWIFRLPGFQRWWMSLRTFPLRNWIVQQLVKISVCDAIDEDVLVFCDSDNTFIRAFEMKSCLMKDNQLALLRVDFQNKDVYEWIENSKKILGIEDKMIQPFSYVSNMITWYKPNILAMRQHIEKVSGMEWICAICRYRNISEYMIYGMFVDHVLGIEKANHFLFDTELMKPSWSIPLKTRTQVETFFEQIQENHIGVMIHSKDKVSIDLYADKIKVLWKKNH